ncbi:MAG: DUF1254 domain-containing protein [Syntrophales bacterium]
MKNWMRWMIATLVLAAIFHVAAVAFLPDVIMAVVSKIALQSSKASVNTAIYRPRETHDQQTIVMPSPDLLYTLCVYDVSQKPLRIEAPVPKDTYFSIAMYAANTDNFFVINDRQLERNGREILLVHKGMSYHGSGNYKIVEAPTPQGIILCRTLITDENRIDEMIRIQHQVTIAPVEQ